jgi:hypothetical protein
MPAPSLNAVLSSDSNIPTRQGLLAAWVSDGVASTDANGIILLNPVMGTKSNLVAAGSTCPDLATGLGPLNQNLVKFTASSAEKFSMSPGFILTGNCSIFFVCAPTLPMSGAMGVLGRSASQSHVMIAANQQKLQVRTTTGAASVDLTLGSMVNGNLQVFQVDADFSAKTGQAFVDGIAGPVITDSNLSSGFIFNQVGCLATSTNPFDGYIGAILMYDHIVSVGDRSRITTWLSDRYRGKTLWVDSATGSDSSKTPWNQTTPLASIEPLMSYTFHGGETIAPKGGLVFRPTSRLDTQSAPPVDTVTIDGGIWGTGKADIRYSSAPTPTLVSGTTYNIGSLTANKTISGAVDNGAGKIRLTVNNTTGLRHDQFVTVSSVGGVTNANGDFYITIIDSTHIDLKASTFAGTYTSGGSMSTVSTPAGFIYYIPGGTVTFTPTTVGGRTVDMSTNVVRLPQDLVMSGGVPASGKWGINGTSIYVNAGAALSAGEIELPSQSLYFMIRILHDGWTLRNLRVMFNEDRGFQVTDADNCTWSSLEAYFCCSDGFDQYTTSTVYADNCVAGWNGRGETAIGGYGDGFSLHDTSRGYFRNCSAFYNDKSGNNGHSGQNSTWWNYIAVGTLPASLTEESGVYNGSMTLYNPLLVVKGSAATPYGAQNTSGGASPLTIYNGTIYSRSGALEGKGIFQGDILAPIVVKNTTISGFLTGIQKFSGSAVFTADHNDLYSNGTNYVNTTAGTGDITSNPGFSNTSGNDFRIGPSSPLVGAGSNLINTDISGNTRVTNDIGAYIGQ